MGLQAQGAIDAVWHAEQIQLWVDVLREKKPRAPSLNRQGVMGSAFIACDLEQFWPGEKF